jgi:hypothetical protein
MPTDLSILPTHGQFLEIYKQLKSNKKLFNRTPIVFCVRIPPIVISPSTPS